ncbi:MAG: hypothetical protein ACR2PX_20095 [Endozoicomonas sp.]|uniref:hypothetical protein n=1 Tax=Endozoicomonas sp. TaxID=1892382 RepID=UPI003D9B32D6
MINISQFKTLSPTSCHWIDGAKQPVGSQAKPDKALPDYAKESFYYANTHQKNGGLQIKPASKGDYEGVYIPYENDKATFSKSIVSGFIASGGFSGCTFQLYNDGNGRVLGTHIYQGGGQHRDLEYEAAVAGWELLYTWETNGLMNDPTMTKSGFVMAIVQPNVIDIVAVRLTGAGRSEKILAQNRIADWKNYNGGAYGGSVGGVTTKPVGRGQRAMSV